MDKFVIGILTAVFRFKIISEQRLYILIEINVMKMVFTQFQVFNFRNEVYNSVVGLV